VTLADRGEAAEERVHEHRPAGAALRDVVPAVVRNGNVMDVDIARGPGELRHVEAVVPLMRLARRQCVGKLPELVEAAHQKPLGARPESHAALEGAIEDRQLAIRLEAEQEQLARLVGGEGEAGLLLGQPRRELPRGGQLKRRGPCCARRLKIAGHAGHAGTSSRPRAGDGANSAWLS
jgi:hypothetical protein